MVKNLPGMWVTQVPSLGQKDPLEKKWQPTLVFLPRESHGQRNLVGYTPWGHKELDTTEHTCTYTHTHTHTHTSLLPYLPNGDGMCRHNIRSF